MIIIAYVHECAKYNIIHGTTDWAVIAYKIIHYWLRIASTYGIGVGVLFTASISVVKRQNNGNFVTVRSHFKTLCSLSRKLNVLEFVDCTTGKNNEIVETASHHKLWLWRDFSIFESVFVHAMYDFFTTINTRR